MTTEGMLRDVRQHEASDTVELGNFLNGFALIHLAHIFEIKTVTRLKDGLQCLLEADKQPQWDRAGRAANRPTP